MQSERWEAMKLMKKSINRKRILRIIKQSLPALPVAIVLIIYVMSFMPRSVRNMERGAALIEYKSYYELDVSGKPVAWFDSLTDSCMSENIMLSADSSITRRSVINGCWVDKYTFIPSCNGMILTTDPDSTHHNTVAKANRNISNVIKNTATRLESAIKLLNKKDEELRYYLSVHNVNDDGYNTMAYLDGRIKKQKEQAEKALEVIKKAEAAKWKSIRLVSKYTVLYKDTANNITRIACNAITPANEKPFRIIQTSDRKTPQNTSATSLHQWFTPSTNAKRYIITASYPGCQMSRYDTNGAKAATFSGKTTGKGCHDIQPMLAPDGAAIYTSDGRMMGISYKGRIISTVHFGYALKNLLP